MTAEVIVFGSSKGGCSKTTTSGIVSWMLSKRGKKVLAVDMDSQGNLTALLTGEFDVIGAFEEKTVLEAIIEGDAGPYIHPVNENLDVLPSNDILSMLSRHMFAKNLSMNTLTYILEPLAEDYDYIIIDTPPNLGEQTLMSLSTHTKLGSHFVVMFDGSKFAYYAIAKFLEIAAGVKQRYNPDIKFLGIAFAIMDPHSKENKDMFELIDENFGEESRFNTIIRRRAATRRIAIEGFEENKEIKQALEFYEPFLEELIERVESKQKVEL